ncbi:hypothetical protein SB2_11920 [Methylobacterium radiotolerans]|nr:hypothetical protein SB3_11115 [Methylobacterium radiotolerans]KTS47997.1 hypothetical protein SB2_11920 [Methylobacterium radiotolerans]
MTRSFRAALALACVAPMLGACQMNAATQQAIAAGAANPGAITAGQVANAVATANPALQAKVSALYGQIKTAGGIACGKAPDLLSAAKILAAMFGGATAVADATLVQTVVSVACTAFGTPVAYTAGTAKATKKPEPKAEPKEGEAVRGVVIVDGPNGTQIPITVNGTVVDPSKAK